MLTRWLQYVHKLGVPEGWGFSDVYDLSEEGLKAVPRPLLALLLLFPVGKVAQGSLGTEYVPGSLGTDYVPGSLDSIFVVCSGAVFLFLSRIVV